MNETAMIVIKWIGKFEKWRIKAGGSQEKIPGRYGGVGGCPKLSFWEIFRWQIDFFLTQIYHYPWLSWSKNTTLLYKIDKLVICCAFLHRAKAQQTTLHLTCASLGNLVPTEQMDLPWTNWRHDLLDGLMQLLKPTKMKHLVYESRQPTTQTHPPKTVTHS